VRDLDAALAERGALMISRGVRTAGQEALRGLQRNSTATATLPAHRHSTSGGSGLPTSRGSSRPRSADFAALTAIRRMHSSATTAAAAAAASAAAPHADGSPSSSADPSLRSLLHSFHTRRRPHTFADAPNRPARSSAVLVGLFSHPRTGAVHVLLTERPSTMRSHAGDVALPGGKRDATDADDVACALREAEEEVGLPRAQLIPFDATSAVSAAVPVEYAWPHGIHLMAPGQPALSKDNLLVRPIIAAIPAPSFLITAAAAAGEKDGENSSSSSSSSLHLGSFDAVCSSAEVSCLFSLPLRCFHDARLPEHSFTHATSDITWRGQHMRLHEFRVTLNHGEYIESEAETQRRTEQQAGQQPLDDRTRGNGSSTISGGQLPPREFRVWGLTAYMLIRCATLLYGQPPLFDIGPGPTKKFTQDQPTQQSSKL